LRFWGWWWWDLQGGSKIGSKRKGNFKQLKLLACGKSVALGLLSGHVQAACSISTGGGGYQCLTAVVVVEMVKNVELPKKIAGTKKNINKKKNGGAQSGEVAIYIVCSFVVTSGYIRSCFLLFLILLHIDG
jgi:hypothetical protein